MKKKIIYDKKYNFLITDHLAGVTTDNTRRVKLVFDNIKSYVYGRKMKYEVSKIYLNCFIFCQITTIYLKI